MRERNKRKLNPHRTDALLTTVYALAAMTMWLLAGLTWGRWPAFAYMLAGLLWLASAACRAATLAADLERPPEPKAVMKRVNEAYILGYQHGWEDSGMKRTEER